ncbi:MAG: hypothetical protein M3Q54_01035 [Actinomycetota bacterium]|jgi:hypothetical protein|nr:hypothetical protein [Rubrobacter sp.]MBA3791061.1 hypothetical protein [Rubrobacter sp.]MDQ3236104.1 hypothetical protein [Actinomycetota bacterium]
MTEARNLTRLAGLDIRDAILRAGWQAQMGGRWVSIYDLTEENRAVRKQARAFAEEEIVRGAIIILAVALAARGPRS